MNRAYQAGRDHFEDYGDRDAPLSGLWAGESIPELSTVYGINLHDDDNATDFEDGFYSAQADPA